MKLSEITVAARWLVALVLVVVAGAASMWLTVYVSPPKMSGWDRLHVTLPLVSLLGYFIANNRPYFESFRACYYFCLASAATVFLLAVMWLSVPGETVRDFLSIFVSVPAAMALFELFSRLRKSRGTPGLEN